MSDQLSSFLASCHHDQAARCRLGELARVFRASLPADEAARWTRTRLLSELAKSFSIGADRRGIAWIAGIALAPPAGWRVEDGQLVRA
jgi:hypothetical protein